MMLSVPVTETKHLTQQNQWLHSKYKGTLQLSVSAPVSPSKNQSRCLHSRQLEGCSVVASGGDGGALVSCL